MSDTFSVVARADDDDSPRDRNSAHPELLQEALKLTFSFYLKAHICHWNVTGSDFPQLHAFFGDIYADAHGAVDDLAEHMRALGFLVPSTPSDFINAASFRGGGTSSADMLKQLSADNEMVEESLEKACSAATNAGNDGLANFLQERLDKHAKWGWQLRATRGQR